MNLPQAFIERTRQLLGETQYLPFEEALQTEVPVSIRPNVLKGAKEVEGEPVPWASSGWYLKNRPTFTFDPLFHAGYYYVQEASSMFVEKVLREYVKEPVVMLDLCAAPGGKSTLCRSVLPEGSLLVANEVMRNRSQILAENLIKWGHPEVIVTNNDPADFTDLTYLFDVILTDVPCSGEGMFRKDQVAVDEWSLENVDICWKRQRRILTDIWPTLKPGGLLFIVLARSIGRRTRTMWLGLLKNWVRRYWRFLRKLDGESLETSLVRIFPFIVSCLTKPKVKDSSWRFSENMGPFVMKCRSVFRKPRHVLTRRKKARMPNNRCHYLRRLKHG